MSEEKIPYKIFSRSEIKEIRDNSVVVEYNGKEWEIKFGKYITKEDIETADNIKVMKYGKQWIVAYANKKGEHGDKHVEVNADKSAEKNMQEIDAGSVKVIYIDNRRRRDKEDMHDFMEAFIEFAGIAREYNVEEDKVLELFRIFIEGW